MLGHARLRETHQKDHGIRLDRTSERRGRWGVMQHTSDLGTHSRLHS
jgi:hypothetical protein